MRRNGWIVCEATGESQQMSSKPSLLPDLDRRNVMKAIGVAGIASAFSTTASARTDSTYNVPGTRNNPLRRSNFEVEMELPGGQVAGWKSIQLPSVTTEVANYREGNQPDSDAQRLWGRTQYDDLTMERGVKQGEMMLWDWRKKAMEGKLDEARTDIAVTILSSTNQPGARFEILGAWPKDYQPPSLDATAAGGEEAIATETVTCAFDRFRRVQ